MRLINAEALKKAFKEKCCGECVNCGLSCDLIDNAPTVEIFCHYQYDGEVKEPCVEAPCPNYERPRGEWLRTELNEVVCSRCGGVRRDTRTKHLNFCNRCGAQMSEEVQV